MEIVHVPATSTSKFRASICLLLLKISDYETLQRSGCFLCESEASATMFYLRESGVLTKRQQQQKRFIGFPHESAQPQRKLTLHFAQEFFLIAGDTP
ncbi:hypothetical protein ACIQGW_22675 [Lysinibacillus xylanilyticus]|uniref:hypothetical protein n=1 Tax=Lysinibacillus xylanilyticus TaxID=582475 RepID=UPI003802D68F